MPPPPQPVSGNWLCRYPGTQFADGSSRVPPPSPEPVSGNQLCRYPRTQFADGSSWVPSPLPSRYPGTGCAGIRELSSRMAVPGCHPLPRAGIRKLAVPVSGNSVRGWQFADGSSWVGCVGREPGTGIRELIRELVAPPPVMNSRSRGTGIRELGGGIRELSSRMAVPGLVGWAREPVSGN